MDPNQRINLYLEAGFFICLGLALIWGGISSEKAFKEKSWKKWPDWASQVSQFMETCHSTLGALGARLFMIIAGLSVAFVGIYLIVTSVVCL